MHLTSFIPRLSRLLVHTIIALTALMVVALLWFSTIVYAFFASGPILDRNLLRLEQNIQILDRNGGLLYQFFGDQNRVYLPTEKIPSVVKNAFVAIEDERFFLRSPCVDVRSVLRAFLVNATTDDTQGASTITQQLVRTLYLSPEKTYKRKILEVMLACRLERSMSRDEILTLYINGVNFGSGVYGVEQAAKAYFGIPAAKLSIAQAAVLAAIPQRPSYFSPYGPHVKTTVDRAELRAARSGKKHVTEIAGSATVMGLLPSTFNVLGGEARFLGRSDLVLSAMRRLSMIDDEEFKKAQEELDGMTFSRLSLHPITAPHFALWMRDEVESLIAGVGQPERWRVAGLRVQTTIDPTLQRIAETTLKHHSDNLRNNAAENAAMVVLDRRSREVLAYVGNVGFFGNSSSGQIDMAREPRQPGSAFKPLVYAAAFERGYEPDTRINDEPLHIGSDVPKNFDGNYKGWMTVRRALSESRNIPAIKAFLDVGGEDVIIDLAARVGMPSLKAKKQEEWRRNPRFTFGWPMAIGSVEVSLLEMVQMYATIADHGTFSPLTYLCSVKTQTGPVDIPLLQVPGDQAIDPSAADGVSEILRDPTYKPEGYWRKILTIDGMNLGAKTGTSNLCFARDSFGNCVEYGVNNLWTIGYSDDLVVGVWVGNADNSPLGELSDGLTVAAPIWREFLVRASRVGEGWGGCGKK